MSGPELLVGLKAVWNNALERIIDVSGQNESLRDACWIGVFEEINRCCENLFGFGLNPRDWLSANICDDYRILDRLQHYTNEHPLHENSGAKLRTPDVVAAKTELDEVCKMVCFRPGLRFGYSLVGQCYLTLDELCNVVGIRRIGSLTDHLTVLGLTKSEFCSTEDESPGSTFIAKRSVWRSYMYATRREDFLFWCRETLGESWALSQESSGTA